MKKRLRRKLKKEEFKEFGFYIKLTCNENLTSDEVDKLTDRFIEEAIEKHDLAFGGGGDYIYQGFITEWKNGSVTEHKKQMIKNWILNQGDKINCFELGELIDANK